MKKLLIGLIVLGTFLAQGFICFGQDTDMFIVIETTPSGADIYVTGDEGKGDELIGKSPLNIKVLEFGRNPETGRYKFNLTIKGSLMRKRGEFDINTVKAVFSFRSKKQGYHDESFTVELYPARYTSPIIKQISLRPLSSQLQEQNVDKKYRSWMELLTDIEKKVLSPSGEPITFDELLSIGLMCCSRTSLSDLRLSEDDERKACEIIRRTIEPDRLPWKPLFYLSLEKERYDDAEILRQSWRNTLIFFSKNATFVKYSDELTLSRIKLQIKKLDIVGLTDPMLIKLRKELVSAITDKKWDDAQKIQSIITLRTEELRPKGAPQIQEPIEPKVVEKVVERPAPSAPTVIVQPPPQVIVQEPSEQRIQVENIPRYNATDVGRAISLMKGRGGRLTGQEAGALQMFNILMGR